MKSARELVKEYADSNKQVWWDFDRVISDYEFEHEDELDYDPFGIYRPVEEVAPEAIDALNYVLDLADNMSLPTGNAIRQVIKVALNKEENK